jgi:hypothetical protein
MGHIQPVAYLFLVADCALRSACSAHVIHAAAISINIALSFSDARWAKRGILPHIAGSGQRHRP